MLDNSQYPHLIVYTVKNDKHKELLETYISFYKKKYIPQNAIIEYFKVPSDGKNLSMAEAFLLYLVKKTNSKVNLPIIFIPMHGMGLRKILSWCLGGKEFDYVIHDNETIPFFLYSYLCAKNIIDLYNIKYLIYPITIYTPIAEILKFAKRNINANIGKSNILFFNYETTPLSASNNKGFINEGIITEYYYSYKNLKVKNSNSNNKKLCHNTSVIGFNDNAILDLKNIISNRAYLLHKFKLHEDKLHYYTSFDYIEEFILLKLNQPLFLRLKRIRASADNQSISTITNINSFWLEVSNFIIGNCPLLNSIIASSSFIHLGSDSEYSSFFSEYGKILYSRRNMLKTEILKNVKINYLNITGIIKPVAFEFSSGKSYTQIPFNYFSKSYLLEIEFINNFSFKGLENVPLKILLNRYKEIKSNIFFVGNNNSYIKISNSDIPELTIKYISDNIAYDFIEKLIKTP